MKSWLFPVAVLFALAALPARAETIAMSPTITAGGSPTTTRAGPGSPGAACACARRALPVGLHGAAGHIPRSRICVTPQARFGFHQARLPQATATLWNAYAADIKGWINQHGGLRKEFIWMRAPDTYRFFRRC